MKNVVLRGVIVHRVSHDDPGEPFISVADAVDVRTGDVMIDDTFVRPDSAAATRYLGNLGMLDARIAATIEGLRGKSIAAMTNQERFDLLAIVARKLGIEVRP